MRAHSTLVGRNDVPRRCGRRRPATSPTCTRSRPRCGRRPAVIWDAVEKAVKASAVNVDAIVAHNASFDRRWFRDEAIKRSRGSALSTAWCGRSREGRAPGRRAPRALQWRWSGAPGSAGCSRWRGCFMRWRGLATTCPRCSFLGTAPDESLRGGGRSDFNAERNALAEGIRLRMGGRAEAWSGPWDEDAAGLPFKVRRWRRGADTRDRDSTPMLPPRGVHHRRELGLLSKTAPTWFRKAPAVYKAWIDGALDDDEESRRPSSSVACSIARSLEPERFYRQYVVAPTLGNCTYKDNKAARDKWRAENKVCKPSPRSSTA